MNKTLMYQISDWYEGQLMRHVDANWFAYYWKGMRQEVRESLGVKFIPEDVWQAALHHVQLIF